MKKLLSGAIALFLIAPAIPAQSIAHRVERQRQRINQGIRSGDLTPREAGNLRLQETRVRRESVRDVRNGGGLTRFEHNTIERQQNRLSRRIYRQRHDSQRRL
jgi:hypothetical protein